MMNAKSIDAKLELKNFLIGLDHSELLQSLEDTAKRFMKLCKKLGIPDLPMGYKFTKSGTPSDGVYSVYYVILEPDFTCSVVDSSGIYFVKKQEKSASCNCSGTTFFDYLMLLCGNSPFVTSINEIDISICFPPEELGMDTPLMKLLRSIGVGAEE